CAGRVRRLFARGRCSIRAGARAPFGYHLVFGRGTTAAVHLLARSGIARGSIRTRSGRAASFEGPGRFGAGGRRVGIRCITSAIVAAGDEIGGDRDQTYPREERHTRTRHRYSVLISFLPTQRCPFWDARSKGR